MDETNPTIRPATDERRGLARDRDPEAAILKIVEGMMDLHHFVPAAPLSPGRRRAAAVSLIAQASRMVRATARALLQYGTELPEAQEDPEALLHLQDDADLLKLLRAHLYLLFMITNDAYLD